MEKYLDLNHNVLYLQNLLNEIKRLTNGNKYYLISYKPARKCDERNKKHLRNVIKKYKRLYNVILKQSESQIQQIFPYIHF